ncbi:MAG: UDP-N-acetylmuramoyl-L-alanyl-D-glutamate--2,6-diaminopimelate ligase [Candidatus Symbiobacter sp.]|nr:UDP-N-acetylmuramoyl-L-alanyl-D-glutamate--2,6-diaminopimelate ligase [Candidatus Symbiobacter sp.]
MPNFRLSDLFAALAVDGVWLNDSGITRLADFDQPITSLASDSRLVRPGALFAALPGVKQSGADFVAAAMAQGAVALLLAADENPDALRHLTTRQNVPIFVTDQPALVLAKLAARFYGRQPQNLVAITGTNGKTSVAWFCQAIWQKLGLRAGMIGTIGWIQEGQILAHGLTTPNAIDLQQYLAAMSVGGLTHVAMEASSHGISQYRLDGVQLRAAGFTNLTRDHLDYHGTMAAYLDAKSQLFTRILPPDAVAVLNHDAAEYPVLAAMAQKRGQTIFQYGKTGQELRLVAQSPHESGQHLTLSVFGCEYHVDLPLIGDFQALNALCALGLVLAAGADQNRAVKALATLSAPPGRAQMIGQAANGGRILIDYAHTPDALLNILTSLRPLAKNRLLLAFGCGGNRDRGKRPIMGEIAARLADYVVVTDDNPRQEEAATIRREIMQAALATQRPPCRVIEIGDRAAAITHLVAQLGAGDIAVVTGKGHESGQIIGDKTLPFDDAEMVAQALRNAGGTIFVAREREAVS